MPFKVYSLQLNNVIIGEEVDVSSLSITFPVGASQGHRECTTFTFIQDNLVEGIECLTVYTNPPISHFIPVCAIDGGGG